MIMEPSLQGLRITADGTLKIPQATTRSYIDCPVGSVFDWAYPKSKSRRARVQGGGMICPAITCSPELYLYERGDLQGYVLSVMGVGYTPIFQVIRHSKGRDQRMFQGQSKRRCTMPELQLSMKNPNPIRLFNIYGENRGTGFAGNVWDKDYISPTITTCMGGAESL